VVLDKVVAMPIAVILDGESRLVVPDADAADPGASSITDPLLHAGPRHPRSSRTIRSTDSISDPVAGSASSTSWRAWEMPCQPRLLRKYPCSSARSTSPLCRSASTAATALSGSGTHCRRGTSTTLPPAAPVANPLLQAEPRLARNPQNLLLLSL